MPSPTNARPDPRLTTQPIARRVGARVVGLDLREPLGGETIEELQWLLADRGVVVFSDQQIGPEHHRALAAALGEIRLPPSYLETLEGIGFAEISVLSTANGVGKAADTWHSDVTWSATPPRYSVLHMQEVPDAAGDTMWASQIEAHDRLSSRMQEFVATLSAEHALGADRTAIHPVVHVHPLTGRRALSVHPTFTTRIVELNDEESVALLHLLYANAAEPEGVCRWSWSPGDVAIWDNHFVLHRVVMDYDDLPRTIHRIEVGGHAYLPASDPAPSAKGSA